MCFDILYAKINFLVSSQKIQLRKKTECLMSYFKFSCPVIILTQIRKSSGKKGIALSR